MNKKERGSKITKIDDTEDLGIKSVAHFHSSQVILLFSLILLFGFTLFCSLLYIGSYYKARDEKNKNGEIVEINNGDGQVVINNNGKINKSINEEDINDNNSLTMESIVSIELNSKNNISVLYNVIYDITKNEFLDKLDNNTDDNVLVRFSYSYDKKAWIYVNNVVSTTDGTLKILFGNYFDIAGLKLTINAISNMQIDSHGKTPNKIYWRSETTFQNLNENIGKNYEAELKILYQDSV